MADTGDRALTTMQQTAANLVRSSPGLAEKLVSGSLSKQKIGAGAGRSDKEGMIADLQRQIDGERDKNRGLEDQIKNRVATFVKREAQTKKKIDSLEKSLSEGGENNEHVQRIAMIEGMHKSVIASVECIQNKTAKVLQEQEKDLMRAFRARLAEMSRDLEAQESKKGDHSNELQARHRRVVAELHEAQALAQSFDEKNERLRKENQKLNEKLRTREDDQQCLFKELALAKKEAARWKAQCKDAMEDGDEDPLSNFGSSDGKPLRARSESSLTRGGRGVTLPDVEPQKPLVKRHLDPERLQHHYNSAYEREIQYRETVQKLKRVWDAEKASAKALREEQACFVQQRTELEVFLRQCLEDVTSEITRQAAEQLRSPDQFGGQSVHDANAQDRQRVLELLLSQQRVVQLLFAKTFPEQPPELSYSESQLQTPNLGDPLGDFGLGDILPSDG